MKKSRVLITLILMGLLASFATGALAQIFNYPTQKKHTFKVCQLLIQSTNWENPDPNIILAMRRSNFLPANWDFDNPLAPILVTQQIWDWWLDGGHAGGGAGTPASQAGYWGMTGLYKPWTFAAPGGLISKEMPQYWEVPLNASTVTQLGNFDLVLITTHHPVVFSDNDLRYLKQIVDAGATLWIDNCHGARIGYNNTSGTFVEDSSRFITRLQFFDDGGASMPGVYWKYAVDPSDAMLTTPFELSTYEIANMGDTTWGTDWVTDYDPQEMHQVVQIGGDATLVRGAYGSGNVIMSGCDVFCDVSSWMEIGLTAPPDSTVGDIKLLYNSCNLSGKWTQQGAVPRHYASSIEDLTLPLSLRWYAPLAGPSRSTPTEYKGVVYMMRDEPDYVVGNSLVGAFDAAPKGDLDNDGYADDGVADYVTGSPADALWTDTMPGVALYNSPAVGTVEDPAAPPPVTPNLDVVVFTTQDPGAQEGYIGAYLARPNPLNAPQLLWDEIIGDNPGSEPTPVAISSPVLHSNVVYVACEYEDSLTTAQVTGFRAYELATGDLVWEYPDPSATYGDGSAKRSHVGPLTNTADAVADWRKPPAPSVAAVRREVNNAMTDTLTLTAYGGTTYQIDPGEEIDLDDYPTFDNPNGWTKAWAYRVYEWQGGQGNTTTSVEVEMTPGNWVALVDGVDYIPDPAQTNHLLISGTYQGHRVRFDYTTSSGTTIDNEMHWIHTPEKWTDGAGGIYRVSNQPIEFGFDADPSGLGDVHVEPVKVEANGLSVVVTGPGSVDVTVPAGCSAIYRTIYRTPDTPDDQQVVQLDYLQGGAVRHVTLTQAPIDTTRDIDADTVGTQTVKVRASNTFDPLTGIVVVEGASGGDWDITYGSGGSHTESFTGVRQMGSGDAIVTTLGTLAPTSPAVTAGQPESISNGRWLDSETGKPVWSFNPESMGLQPSDELQSWYLDGNMAWLDRTPIMQAHWWDVSGGLPGLEWPGIAALQLDAPLAIKFSNVGVSELSTVECLIPDPLEPGNPFVVRGDQYVVDYENGVILFDAKAAGNIIGLKELATGDLIDCRCGSIYNRELIVEVDGVEVVRSKTDLARWIYTPYVLQTHRYPIDTGVATTLEVYTPTGLVDISAVIANVDGDTGKIELNAGADPYEGRKVLVTYDDLGGTTHQEMHFLPYDVGPTRGSLSATNFLIHTGTAPTGEDLNLDGVPDDGRLLSLEWDPSEDSVRPYVWPRANFRNYFENLMGAPGVTAVFSAAASPGSGGLYTTAEMHDGATYDSGFLVGLYSAETLIADNNRIVELAGNGKVTWEAVGTREVAPAGYMDANAERSFNRPQAMKLLHTGNLLVADTGNNRVVEFDRGGQLIWPVDNAGRFNSDILDVRDPVNVDREELPVDFNGDGLVDDYLLITVVADQGNHRLLATVHYESRPDITSPTFVLSSTWALMPGVDRPFAARYSTVTINKPTTVNYLMAGSGWVSQLSLQVLAGVENDGRVCRINRVLNLDPASLIPLMMATPPYGAAEYTAGTAFTMAGGSGHPIPIPMFFATRMGHIQMVRIQRDGRLILVGSMYERDINNWTGGAPTPAQYVNNDADFEDLIQGVFVVDAITNQLIWSYTAADYYADPGVDNIGPGPGAPWKAFKPIWAEQLDSNNYLIVNHCYNPTGWNMRSSEVLELTGPAAPAKVILEVMPDPNLLAEDAKTYPIEQPACVIRR